VSRSLALAAGLLLLAHPAAGQSNTIDSRNIQRVRPASCALSDSLAGRPIPRPGRYALGWREVTVNNFASDGPFSLTGYKPIDGIILTAISEGPGPHPDAVYALQLRLKDTVLRDGGAAALVIILDDTLRTEVGDMLASETPFSRGNKIDQMLTQALPTRLVRRMMAATKVSGSIGATPFTVPPRTLETFRAVFIGATCGERL
jgi:hypothetical protein